FLLIFLPRNSGVLPTDQIILIGIVLYYLVCVPPECEYFKLVYWKFFDLICLGTTEMPNNDALHMPAPWIGGWKPLFARIPLGRLGSIAADHPPTARTPTAGQEASRVRRRDRPRLTCVFLGSFSPGDLTIFALCSLLPSQRIL